MDLETARDKAVGGGGGEGAADDGEEAAVEGGDAEEGVAAGEGDEFLWLGGVGGGVDGEDGGRGEGGDDKVAVRKDFEVLEPGAVGELDKVGNLG